MQTRPLLIILALASTLYAPGTKADCNRPSTDYERQDCAFKADRDFRRGNSEVDQATGSYLENLRRSSEQEEEDRRQAKQQQEAAESQRMQQEEMRRRGEEADRKEREFQRQYGTPRQREQAYEEARSSYNAAQHFEQEGQHKWAEELYRKAEKSMAIAAIDHPHDYPLVIESLGESLRKQGRYEEALPVLLDAVARRRGLTHEYHPMNGDALISLGRTYDALGRYGEAEPVLLKALQIRQKQYGKSSQDAAYCHVYLGTLYTNQKRFDKAQAHYSEAITIRTAQLGVAHADTIRVMKQLAALYRQAAMENEGDKLDRKIQEAAKDPQYTSKTSKPPQTQPAVDWKIEWNKLSDEAVSLSADRKIKPALAIEKARQALALSEKNDDPKQFNVASSQDLLAQMLWRDGQTDEAELLFKSALKTFEKSSESKIQAAVAKVSISLAKLHEFQKRGAEAEPLYKRALAIREKRIDQDLPGLIDVVVDLEDYYERRKRSAEREPLLKRLVELQEKNRGPEHIRFAEAIYNYARYLALLEKPRYDESETLYKRALAILEKKPDEDKQLILLTLMSLRELYVKTDRKEDVEKIELREKEFLARK